MGSLTSQLKFYKPAETEFVDVDTQLNRNWDIADSALKRLLEYEYTLSNVPDTVDALTRSRFYKTYSNSIMTWFKSSNTFYQDPSAFVSSWEPANSYFTASGFTEHPEFPIKYRVVRRSSGFLQQEVEWTGAFWLNGDDIDANTNTSVIAAGGLPTIVRPVTNKYFDTNCGNTTANYSMARILIGSNGGLEFKRYGTLPAAGSDEMRVELTGITYNIEATGA